MALKLAFDRARPSAVKPPPHSNQYYGYKRTSTSKPGSLDGRVKRKII